MNTRGPGGGEETGEKCRQRGKDAVQLGNKLRHDGQEPDDAAYHRRRHDCRRPAAKRTGECRRGQGVRDTNQQRSTGRPLLLELAQTCQTDPGSEGAFRHLAGHPVEHSELTQVDAARRRDQERAMLVGERSDSDFNCGGGNVGLRLWQLQFVAQRQE